MREGDLMEFSHRGTDRTESWDEWYLENVQTDDDVVQIATGRWPAYRSAETIVASEAVPRRFVDLAVDSCGELFLLAEDGGIHRYLGGDGCDGFVRLDCPTEDVTDPRAIAVTTNSIYVASGDSGRVRVYSRQAIGLRREFEAGISDPVGFVDLDGAIHVVDRGERAGQGVIARLSPDRSITPVVTDLYEPIDVDATADGALYVLEPKVWGKPEQFVIRKIPPQVLAHPPVPAVDTVWIPPGAFRTVGSAAPVAPACIAAGGSGELLVGGDREGAGEDAVFSFRSKRAAFAHQADVPEGCRALVSDRSGDSPRLYLLDGEGSLVVVTARTERQRNRRTGAFDARIRARLDSGHPDNQWHRIRLESDLLESDTEVTLRYAPSQTGDPERFSPDPGSIPGDLTVVSGVGPRKAWRLRRAGIEDVGELAASDPETVANIVSVEEIEVPENEIRGWLTEAESLLVDGTDRLRAVEGIGRAYASRLESAGIDTLDDLVVEDAATIASLLGSRIRTVSTDRTAGWIEDAAARLPDSPDIAELDWQHAVRNPDDVFLRDAVGRYLWVEIALVGTAVTTPELHSIDVTYPRQTYLDELPAVYRADEETYATLEPFLGLFESILSEVGESIEDLATYMDPDGIPAAPGYLEWLGSWLAADLDASWPSAVKRAFIDAAPELYRMRGTRRGLKATIDLYLEHVEVDRSTWDAWAPEGEIELVRVLEHGELACARDPDVAEIYSRVISCPQGFLVLLHPALEREHVSAIGRIVGHQRPAHTSGRAVALRPVTVLTGHENGERGHHSYLGVNAVLSDQAFTVEQSVLGQETVVTAREPHGALGVRSQLDEDTRLS